MSINSLSPLPASKQEPIAAEYRPPKLRKIHYATPPPDFDAMPPFSLEEVVDGIAKMVLDSTENGSKKRAQEERASPDRKLRREVVLIPNPPLSDSEGLDEELRTYTAEDVFLSEGDLDLARVDTDSKQSRLIEPIQENSAG